VQPDKRTTMQKRPLRILIAEDIETSQRVAQQMLQHYDIVFMDIKMPEMDGVEATRIIRQRWPDNGPKIIALTAYGLEGDREKFIEAGMDDYIAKPVKKEDLAKVLEKYQSL
jgi:CheY-like chemotaxis protein